MRDPLFRNDQAVHMMDSHIKPVNELVDRFIGLDDRGWMPYVAPIHGGTKARVLSVLRDPGPKTRTEGGSGFLCVENDDPTAESQAELFVRFGIEASDVLPWNAYPWYINRAPTAAELEAGASVLIELLPLLPVLRVILLQGRDAAAGWRRVATKAPKLVGDKDLMVVECIHPSRQALWTSDPMVRQQRLDQRDAAYASVAGALAK
ncbi:MULTISPECIES: uracil-DNA glycosylase [unclassified Mycobacterium]|uniref:uracil-DNA glycosylase n=1 Tax=unclassified Mycobacterium TaxID=2642494 RepID=UPI0029C76F28|nr:MULTISPECIES: uracil-DNA glycosylase [unclassified Mycobacterium]